MTRYLLIPAMLCLGLVGCAAATSDHASPAATPVSTSARPATSAQCTTTKGLRSVAMRAAGHRRTFLLATPPGVGPRPLIVLFHGYGESARWIASYTRLVEPATRAGYVVAVPQGTDDRWNFQRNPAAGPDDVQFFRRMVAHLEQRGCVGAGEVFVAGFSDGADMADEVACAASVPVRAVAGVAASVVPAGCAHSVSVLQIHGTGDPVVPFAGGGPARSAPYSTAIPVSVADQMRAWRRLDGCADDAAPRRLSPTVRIDAAMNCNARLRVDLLTVTGGGHTWPGAQTLLPYGRTDRTISATEEILQFFSASGA